ncbi:hypothetical protein ACFLT7_05920 [candidate division KSB1 bacterium]
MSRSFLSSSPELDSFSDQIINHIYRYCIEINGKNITHESPFRQILFVGLYSFGRLLESLRNLADNGQYYAYPIISRSLLEIALRLNDIANHSSGKRDAQCFKLVRNDQGRKLKRLYKALENEKDILYQTAEEKIAETLSDLEYYIKMFPKSKNHLKDLFNKDLVIAPECTFQNPQISQLVREFHKEDSSLNDYYGITMCGRTHFSLSGVDISMTESGVLDLSPSEKDIDLFLGMSCCLALDLVKLTNREYQLGKEEEIELIVKKLHQPYIEAYKSKESEKRSTESVDG